MLSEWSQFAERHWIMGGTLASLLWFLAARQSLSNRRPDAAIFWQSVAVIIMLIVCGWAVAQREWLGLAFAVAVLCVEVLSIRRIYATRGSQH
jgi:CHASE2 domain-containing sensor protein